MSHTHARVLVHCIFSTEERANLIPDPVELCRYLTGVARAKEITLVAAGGTANHIHLLIAVPPAIPLAKGHSGVEGQQLAMVSRARSAVRVAGRIWGLQRQPVAK